MTLPRPSYRQLLVLAFVLVAALLAAVAVRGLFTLERLLQQSRDGAASALLLAAGSERLAEQAVTMERAARQYLVLGDPLLRRTFERAGDAAREQLGSFADGVLPAELAARWQQQLDLAARQLDGSADALAARDAALVGAFRELAAINAEVGEEVRAVIGRRSAALQEALERQRAALARQVLLAVVFALALALAFAWWLARPLARVEAAIVRLGENRLDERVAIRGPADVRRLGRRLDWLRQRLAEGDADKARFLRHVSHDLKTPLAALREGVALLEDGVAGPLSADQREVARILRDNTATLQRRIEDLLNWNAAAFAAQRLVRRPVELGALVRRLIDEQQLQWRARGLTVAVEGAPLTAEVDAELLGSALANLLINAIRFSPPGGTVTVALAREGALVRIEVADQGPGVPEADAARIFEPFYRGSVQPDGGLPGSGIGLSIVAETVAAHGGRVQLRPADPERPGARFRIELPHALAD
ncbi:MAG: HAMP domain-containing protein [Rubrivivax sp.]|nr:HAMP domain-containing protein [Rubrivivax sp.]